jgi:hypothetical protein
MKRPHTIALFFLLLLQQHSLMGQIVTDPFGFGSTNQLVTKVISICQILGAICGVIGGGMTYTKMIDNRGHSSHEDIRNWFIACVALLLLPILLRQAMVV